MREALIQGENQIAITEEGRLVNYFSFSKDFGYGDIYWGRVVKCASGNSGACFVDIGGYEPAFCPQKGKMLQGESGPFMVESAPHSKKSVKVSSNIKINLGSLVSLPQKGAVRASLKITDKEQQKRFKRLGDVILERFPQIEGILFRTNATLLSDDAVLEAAAELNSILANISAGKSSPGLIYRPDFVTSVLGMYSHYDSIVTDDTNVYKKISKIYPQIRLRPGSEFSLFDVKNISSQLVSLTGKKVWLPSGGNLIIEHTEAMTVIDVNSAKAIGNKADGKAVNKEAVEEIMRQLRLRNIGGIIICDLISMEEQEQNEILSEAYALAEKDPEKPTIHGFTSLGLLEISRKRK